MNADAFRRLAAERLDLGLGGVDVNCEHARGVAAEPSARDVVEPEDRACVPGGMRPEQLAVEVVAAPDAPRDVLREEGLPCPELEF